MLVINDTGKTVNVGPFTSTLGSLKSVPIIDCVVAYDCPYTNETIYLSMYNVLYVKEMEENLLPPFVVRREGHILNDVPKIQVDNPTEDDHCILLKGESKHRIPLRLVDTTLYFDTRCPTEDEYLEAAAKDIVYDLNVDEPSWDPHDPQYALDEECMLDFEGKIIDKTIRDRRRDYSDDNLVISTFNTYNEEVDDVELKISAMSVNDGVAQSAPDNTCYDDSTRSLLLQEISPALEMDAMAEAMVEECMINKLQHSIKSSKLSMPRPKGIKAVQMDKPKGVNAEILSKVFRIDLATAKRTLKVTSQRLKRSKHPSLHRRYGTNDRMLRYKHIRQYFFMDTMFATKKSGKTLRGNTCLQLFVTDKGFVHVVPMKTKGEVHLAMKEFFKRIGVPDAIVCDPAKEQILGDTKKLAREAGTVIRAIEPNTPWSNRAERYIGIFKQGIRDTLRDTHAPLVLWDFCALHKAKINNATAKGLFQLHGVTPHEATFGEEPDISNICQFGFYDWVYYREQTAKFPYPSEMLGRVLGPSDGEGNEMSQWILRVDGRIIARQTVRPLTPDEYSSKIEQTKRQAFDENIRRTLGDSWSKPPDDPAPDDFHPYEDDDDGVAHTMLETDDLQYDKLVNAEVLLPHRDKVSHATVIGRTKDSDGNEKGRTDDNPMLNTAVYDVLFPDGAIKQYSANIIAENMWAQVDAEGNQYLVLDAITGHRRHDNAVDKSDQYITTSRGNRKLRQTTVGWDLCVQWKTGEEQWVPLKDLKESNPVEVADYAKANGLTDEPAFKWWTPYVLRKRDYIISKVAHRVKKKTHKYGIRIPKTVKEAYEIDKMNGNSFWTDAIEKEMTNVSIAFEILENDEGLMPGYSLATCHLIFDVKMDFTRKARFVLDGHKTPDPEGSTWAGVVSRESVRIALTYAALNDIDICAADILNAYLQAPSSKKHYIICGLEFGLENVGKRAKIVRALYGGKTSGRDFRNHLRSCMDHLEFESCKADPDVWRRPSVKSDGTEYYEYALLYVDDVLMVSENAEVVLRKEIGKYFTLKKESIGMPDIYLGGKVSQVVLNNGAKAYSFSSAQYVKAAVDNVEKYLKEKKMKLPCRVSTPLSANYRPEIDISEELSLEDAAYYQSLIGVLRWMVELGRVDITCEVSMMSSHVALPRTGHLQQLFHIFAYLKKTHNTEMVFDPSDMDMEIENFERHDWSTSEFGNVTESLPANAPTPRGMGFAMTAFVDSDHAGDLLTRRSRTGFLVYLNSAPIYWYSKKQNSIETSSFGSEFTALKQCTEYLRGLRFKLRMMGIPVQGPSYVFGDNKSVLTNASIPDSVLRKKSNSIAYNFVREGTAMNEWTMAYVNTHDNPADMLTKPLSGEKRMKFIRMILYHI